MKPSEVLACALAEQARARAIVADLGPCPIRLSRATVELGSFSVGRDGTMEIRISSHIGDAAQVRETARHELAHQAAWERYRHVGHGAPWQTMASYLDCEPVACSSFTVDPEIIQSRQRYAVSCARCGWETTRQRRSKLVARPGRYVCAACGGRLSVALLASGRNEL